MIFSIEFYFKNLKKSLRLDRRLSNWTHSCQPWTLRCQSQVSGIPKLTKGKLSWFTSVENESVLPLRVPPDGPVAAGDVGRLLVISEVTWQQVGHRTRAAHSQAVRISRLSFCKVHSEKQDQMVFRCGS